jgi:antitoxin component HigA of HigAB toxin-antitoxin module
LPNLEALDIRESQGRTLTPEEAELARLRQRDLIPVFGASSTVSDVVNGKRPMMFR